MQIRREEKAPAAPTVEDVARAADVSTATVSRCLNAPDRVSERTRERVMAAVRELGYAPNFGARALAAKRTNTFGAIIPTMENAIFARGLQAFQEALGQNGVTLLVASSSYRPDLEEDQIRELVARGADALLLIGHDRTPASYAFLEQRRIPVVHAWVHDPASPRISIGFDNRAAMKALAHEVMARGHDRLGVITAAREGNDRARERFAGICDAMAERGLDPASLAVEETPYSIPNGAEAFTRLMARDPRPTAILCGNDVLAVGALGAARKMGIDVPGSVSITGFDDIEIAEIVQPSLTTVHVPHREMGRRAAELLLALRNGDAAPQSVALPTHIVWRDSLGPAPKTPA
ncbi:transcriptional regulator, LacI family [Roseivivax lentus]|uniref:Transcriptional regulator, LacI family n=1 Tax=Roseivivax lentus TaxID=633194 RepID=A0A1N7L107_9RHOB|nr:LacI family DNA-binding transcriptional regulator [Roseivivax lentus]SIS67529.1 transcriptional regulator, LacI family [Roseivivax lentus]